MTEQLSERPLGYRLHRFEVLNWGTFHQQVWKLGPKGQSALLTGDIGSGKSTLVDALTTLLVPRPANQIVFNKAAGAEAQERTLASYMRGEYKNAVDEGSHRAKAVSLRDDSSYSVLLAWFFNEMTGQGVCLAQVFCFREKGGQVERLFLVAEQDLTIAGVFKGFKDLTQLRLKLRKLNVKVCEGLKDYATSFRRIMGIESDKALELFYQTVSMKSVANLTDFVRDHMLESGDARERVDALCQSFHDLDRAHKAVVKARQQITELKPIAANGAEHQKRHREVTDLRMNREYLEKWKAKKAISLEEDFQREQRIELSKATQRIEAMRAEAGKMRAQEDGLRQAIAENGGARLHEIAREIIRLEKEFSVKNEKRTLFRSWAKTLNLPMPITAGQFDDLSRGLDAKAHGIADEEQEAENRLVELSVTNAGVRNQIQKLDLEIESLRNRTSNIPSHLLQLRANLCEALGIAETELPFAGELMQVLASESAWEGAIERVLHNFALSLLVEEKHYHAVSDWVNRVNLRGRLVYYRVGIKVKKAVNVADLANDSLVRKLQLKEDGKFYDWLLAESVERFDYTCCADLDSFRRHRRALTQQGQIKFNEERHEKDDRHSLLDRARYVLGWSNKAKLKVLQQQLSQLREQDSSLGSERSRLNERRARLKELSMNIGHMRQLKSFEEIHPEAVAAQMQDLRAEQSLIESGSDKLRELKSNLDHLQKTQGENQSKIEIAQKKAATCESEISRSERAVAEHAGLLVASDADQLKRQSASLDGIYGQIFSEPPTLHHLSARERAMREKIQAGIDALDKQVKLLAEKVVRDMQSYRTKNPVETQEVDASLDSLRDFERMLSDLERDGLPRFEARFKQELNEKTIQSLAQFQNRLDKARRDINERIMQINSSLRLIDYNEGSFIELRAKPVQDKDIRDFQQDLRSCLEGTLGEDLYDEQRFLKVKVIIERFSGREGFVDLDRRWTARVTDVRNWFEFSASELWRADSSLREYYEGGGGKSGGQKEKLAYTVLASALAYQFGIDRAQQSNLRSFRFVMIDEAFGKGSDDSTRYGLELFAKMGLQLLVVTPLQKIRVIEDYVRHVHFVHNEGGCNSVLRNFTIEEYHEARAEQEKWSRHEPGVQISMLAESLR